MSTRRSAWRYDHPTCNTGEFWKLRLHDKVFDFSVRQISVGELITKWNGGSEAYQRNPSAHLQFSIKSSFSKAVVFLHGRTAQPYFQ